MRREGKTRQVRAQREEIEERGIAEEEAEEVEAGGRKGKKRGRRGRRIIDTVLLQSPQELQEETLQLMGGGGVGVGVGVGEGAGHG